jgi:predicted MFS family arabinose efflux permease
MVSAVSNPPATAASASVSASASVPAPAAWLAVASLAVSTFASVTTEFLPVGLLTNIAAGLGVTEGTAGLMITMPAVMAALTGPLLIVLSGRLDRRTVVLVLSALLVASNVLAAVAPNFATMLVARVMLGVVVGGFWTFAPSVVARLVPEPMMPRAMSYVLAGISLATVAGVPAGALLGDLAGWRMAFVVAAVVAAVVLAMQLRLLPRMPAERAIPARDLLVPLTRPGSRAVLGVGLLLITGHFVGYTYLRPMLDQIFGLSPNHITAMLLVFGVAGLVGTFLGGRLVGRSLRGTPLLAAAAIAAALLFATTVGGGLAGAALVTALWGAAFGLVPVAMTTWMQKALPDASEAGQALLVVTFQVSISSGAFVGGRIADASGVAGTLQLGAALAIAAGAVILVLARQRGAAVRGATVEPCTR